MLSKSLLLSPVLKLSIELRLCWHLHLLVLLVRRPRATHCRRRPVAILVQDCAGGRPRHAGLRTAYLCISLTTCRQLLTGKRSARSAVHGGARAPARNTTSLSQTSCIPARGVQREVLQEGLQHVRVQVGLLEQQLRNRTSRACEAHLSL